MLSIILWYVLLRCSGWMYATEGFWLFHIRDAHFCFLFFSDQQQALINQ